MDTESTDISNDGPRQPSTEIDDTGARRAGPPPQGADADQNGASSNPSSTTRSDDGLADESSSASDDPSGEAAAAATTSEPATMATPQTDSDPSTGSGDAAGNTAATATPIEAPEAPTEATGTGGATSAGEAVETPAAANPRPAGTDPVTDAVTIELPAVPAGVQGLDDAPAGPSGGADRTDRTADRTDRTADRTDTPPGAAGDRDAGPGSGGTSPATPGGTSTPTPTVTPAGSSPAAPSSSTPPAPADDLAATTEMPKIDAPAPPAAPAGSGEPGEPRGGGRPVYEVRAAATRADQPPAPTDSATVAEPPAASPTRQPSPPPPPTVEPPVTEPIPTVLERRSAPDDPTTVGERSSTVRGEPTQVLGTDRPRHFHVGPAKPINTGEIDKIEDEPQRRYPRAALIAVLAPLVAVMLLIVAWAADTAALSGQVLRNVEVAGRQIGGKGEEALPEIMADVAAEQADRAVTIEMDGRDPYQATAADLGLTLDEDATMEAALDMGRGDTVFVRPLKWIKSFFSAREVPLRFTVTETQTAAMLQLLQGEDRTAPTDPSIRLTDAGFMMTEGRAGQGIDVSKVATDLLAEAQASTDGPITIQASAEPVQPQFSDQEAQQLADRANALTADGITLKADTTAVPVPAHQLRSWIDPTVVDGELDLKFNAEKATAELPALFADLDAEPTNASMTLEGGVPTVVPGENGVTCCGDNAATLIWDGVTQEKDEVELEAVIEEPEITTEDVESWGIKEPVGGSRGWRNGADIAGPAPGFTTFHACCAPRVTNIQRIADLVQGTVIPPGGTFSVNDTVGKRTREKGFVEAGAIRDGEHVPEVGGGISQFATTTFNAAYFAGLDIETYQAHSEYFSRYPLGREATMGHPAPDLVIHNNTPYGVMIWTSHTDTSLTVTMYSTTYASAEQTGITEGKSGNCRVVTTTRTRTYPDRPSETDTFRATYRPGEGEFC